ncbi:MAG TPA: DUF2726 domain-containing protein [Chloroflexota bacterium]|jgi:hypothetical protein|nr:DUF2726 domain-containing protein [Chloroflexota bacterium]
MSHQLGLILLAALAALGGLTFLHYLRRRSRPALPYRKTDHLLTPAERSFYEVLRRIIGDDLRLFVKVRLADLVWLPHDIENRQAHVNRVAAKHIDFVLCDPRTFAPVLAVELDDSSHEARHRQQRDALVNAVLRTVGVPLLRVPVKRSYVPSEVAEDIRSAMRG